MPNGTRDMPGAPGEQPAATPALPDLTGVGLRFLREQDDPCLALAVDHVLGGAGDFTESWWGDGTNGGNGQSCVPPEPSGSGGP